MLLQVYFGAKQGQATPQTEDDIASAYEHTRMLSMAVFVSMVVVGAVLVVSGAVTIVYCGCMQAAQPANKVYATDRTSSTAPLASTESGKIAGGESSQNVAAAV